MELADWHAFWKATGAAQLRALLMKHWDPIGVAAFEDSAADEYDAYVGQLGRMLREGTSARQIADYLHGIRTDWMGLGEQRGTDAHVAALVVAWYEGVTRA